MKILVTGASGYIGSILVPMLREKKFSVFGIDRISPKIDINYFDDFFIADLSNAEHINNLCTDIDILIHLAGEAATDACSASHVRNNYIASKNIYLWSVKNCVKKIIFLSTNKIDYRGSYSESKKKSENILIDLCNQNNANYTILRSAPVYGKGMKGGLAILLERYSKILIPNVTRSESVFSMIGIHDLCAAVIFCIKNNAVDKKIYEISDNIIYKISDIDTLMKSSIGHNKKYIKLPRWLLWLVSKLCDLLNFIGLNTPFSKDRYHLLYKNTPIKECLFFKQHGLVVKDNFMDQIPLIIGK